MHIGLVTATYLPSRNGVATSTAQFARGLREAGHTVSIFAPQHPQQQPEEGVYRLPSTVLRRLPDYPLMLPGPPPARALPRGLDILHTMHPFVAGQRALAWGRELGIPVVYTAHTQYTEYLHYTRVPPQFSSGLMKNHVAMFARRCAAVLAPGQAMTEMLRAYGYRGPVRLLPNPVDLTPYQGLDRQAARARLGLSGPVLAYLGRLAPEKNLSGLLAAFAQARQSVPELQLLVIGDGPSRAAFQQQAAQQAGVHFTGAVPYEQVPATLAAADLFITASTSEVLPMSMIEALAAGLPLVAMQSPAARDLIAPGQNGYLADTPQDLARSALAALGELPRLQAAARAAALRYERSALVSELLEVYRQARAGHKPRRGVDKPGRAM